MKKIGNLGKRRISLLAPTGVAVINITVTTIHTGLDIDVGGKMYPLNNLQKPALRKRL